MEEGVLWRADVMEGPCAVARWKDISVHTGQCTSRAKMPATDQKTHRPSPQGLGFQFPSVFGCWP
jgi:hypothetical protein